jgi:hypothetical protein
MVCFRYISVNTLRKGDDDDDDDDDDDADDKVVAVHTIKAYRGERDIVPLILNPSARWR